LQVLACAVMAALTDMDGQATYKGIYLGAMSALVRAYSSLCTRRPTRARNSLMFVPRCLTSSCLHLVCGPPQKNDYGHGQGKTALHMVKAVAVLIDRLRRDDAGKGGAAAAHADADAVHMPLVATARPDPPCEVNCVAWRPGGGEGGERVLAAACDDGCVRVWRVAGVQEGEAG